MELGKAGNFAHLTPGVRRELKLRLRGLDTPELSNAAGRTTKRFVDALVAKATALIISTTKPGKYDRYLADVFLSVTGDGGTRDELRTRLSAPGP